MSGKPKPAPQELDPSVTSLILRGLSQDIESGRIEVIALEKIPYRGSATLIVNFVEVKKS